MKPPDITKLREFKGKINGKLLVPSDYRRWSAGSRKILKLWFRLNNTKIFWPSIIKSVKDLSAVWARIGRKKFHGKPIEDFLVVFDEIDSFSIEDVLRRIEGVKTLNLLRGKIETTLQETRERKDEKCSICGVFLVFPAYVLQIIDEKEIMRSNPLGIFCLHDLHGKLEKFLSKDEIQAILEEIKQAEAAEVPVHAEETALN